MSIQLLLTSNYENLGSLSYPTAEGLCLLESSSLMFFSSSPHLKLSKNSIFLPQLYKPILKKGIPKFLQAFSTAFISHVHHMNYLF